MSLQKLDALRNLRIGHFSRMAEHDTTRALNLIVEEFTEVLHVHLALIGVNYCRKSAKHRTFGVCTLDCLDNVGKLTDARRLDKNSVGSIFGDNLLECLRKIAYKRATDATRVHLVDLYSRLGKKSAVDAYLTELIFNKDDLLALVCFFNKLLYKSGLSRTEKSRKNINFSHFIAFLICIYLIIDLEHYYLVPVDPKPPVPRTVSSSSSQRANSAV